MTATPGASESGMHPAATAAPEGEPLTHFFHCWRFPRHHACAVALIERQQEETDQQRGRAVAAERELAEVRRAAAADSEAAHLAGALRDIRDANPAAPAGAYARNRAVVALIMTGRMTVTRQGAPEPAEGKNL